MKKKMNDLHVYELRNIVAKKIYLTLMLHRVFVNVALCICSHPFLRIVLLFIPRTIIYSVYMVKAFLNPVSEYSCPLLSLTVFHQLCGIIMAQRKM